MLDVITQAFAEGLCKYSVASLRFVSERVHKALPRGGGGAGVHRVSAPGGAVPARLPDLRESEFERAFADRGDEAVLQAIDCGADTAQAVERTARHDFDADERRLWLPAYVRSDQPGFRVR